MEPSNGAYDSPVQHQPTSLGSSVPFTSSSPQVGQSSVRRLSRTEDSRPYPIPGLAADILHMRVKEGSKIRNLLRFATSRMQGGEGDSDGTSPRQVVFTGSGRGVTKTITCVEILKRKVGGLHQVSKLHYRTVNEVWESPQQGASGVTTMDRKVPAICILLSKDPLDPLEPGYQPPLALGVPTEAGERRAGLFRTALNTAPPDAAKRLRLDEWNRILLAAHPYVTCLAYLNSCLNPLLYVACDPSFRKRCRGALCGLCRRPRKEKERREGNRRDKDGGEDENEERISNLPTRTQEETAGRTEEGEVEGLRDVGVVAED